MKKKIIGILKKPFVKSVIVMITGTMGAQLIKMALSPIITRIYGPEAFGVMGVFMSIFQIIIPIAAFTYPIAIVLPKNDINAKTLIKLSIYISTTIATVSFLLLLFFNKEIARFFNLQEISVFLYLIPIVIIFSTITQVSEQWYIRTKQFKITAKATFYQSLIIELSKIGIGYFHPIATVLVILTTLNNGLKALLLTLLGRKSNYKLSIDSEERQLTIKQLMNKYKDFPLLRAPQATIDAITQSLPILLLTSFFSPISAGFYTLCRTVLALPTSFIGKAVGDVFYPRINEAANNKENLTALIKKSVLSLSGLGVIPFGLIIAFGPWLFGFVFGDEWIIAGEYARWIAFSSFFRFINEPCLRALPVLSAQVFHLISTIVHTVSRVLALAIGFYIFKDDTIAIALLGIIGGIINLLLVVMTIILSKNFDKRNV